MKGYFGGQNGRFTYTNVNRSELLNATYDGVFR